MGYTTQFEGELKFVQPVTDEQRSVLGGIFGEDCRDHPEWFEDDEDDNFTYMDFELTKKGDGIKWDGSEKSYDMVEKVNIITKLMRRQWPDFKFTGKMFAQGESIGDVWFLMVDETGEAYEATIDNILDDPITCPHCKETFTLK